ncbi:putative IBR domain, a half RING-finger domain containing protein [Leishmania naiffi]|uniref:RBR-type E3 ubiquitin transferase n=1 Tax=Leishmania naiffi TaxID=5678 RepID=A0AAW3BH27_9TRYP
MYDPEYDREYYGEDEDDYTYEEQEAEPTVMGSADFMAEQKNEQCEGRTMDISEVLAMQSAVVQEVVNLTCLSTSMATLLLRRYRWSRDVAVERYFENSKKVLQDFGITEEASLHEATLCFGRAGAPTVCGICAMEYNPHEVACLSTCRHYFCLECWRDHIKSRILENLLGTSCPEQDCCELVGLFVMRELFAKCDNKAQSEENENILGQIHRKYLTGFVETCPTLYWCPNPHGCAAVIYAPVPPLQGQGVLCLLCNSMYCLRCSYEPHRPSTCENMRQWKNYCSKEGANLAYILSRTKQCPECKKTIEKSGGCNHMTCKCSHEFCWVCLGPWRQHSGDYYSCRNVEHHGAAASEEAMDSSKRFTYHYERYTLHLDSAERDEKLIHTLLHNPAMREQLIKTQRVVDDKRGPGVVSGALTQEEVALVDSTCAKSEVVSRVTKTLFTAREVLAHSYVAMFYLSDNGNEGQLMAHRVGKLEEATEAMSGSLVKLITSTKSQMSTFFDAADVLVAWTKALCDV